tara:strand:+ start:940 stop:1203 length:264 start_codon:yes stop_codon:yes gene_type:complete
LIAAAVAKDVDLQLEKVHTQGVSYQHGQAIDTSAEVDRIATKVHYQDVFGRSHYGRTATAIRTTDKISASTFPLKATAMSLGNCTRP